MRVRSYTYVHYCQEREYVYGLVVCASMHICIDVCTCIMGCEMRNCSTTVCGCPLAIGSAGKVCSPCDRLSIDFTLHNSGFHIWEVGEGGGQVL